MKSTRSLMGTEYIERFPMNPERDITSTAQLPIDCPNCEGTGEVMIIDDHSIPEAGLRKSYLLDLRCDCCKGTGLCSEDEYNAWKADEEEIPY